MSFAALDGSVWGAALDAGEPAVVFGTPSQTGGAAGTEAVRFSPHDGGWELSGAGLQVSITPTGDSAETVTDRPPPGADELCRVHGKLVLDGSEIEVDCPGTLSCDELVDVHRLDSIRGVWGWFEDDQALALLALRRRGDAGHEGERLAASLFDLEGPIVVDEPRLSTTYTADGLPSRATLELWIGEGDEQYPRRAAAEALGPRASATGPAVSLQGSPLRCHSRGLDGPGVYLLARF